MKGAAIVLLVILAVLSVMLLMRGDGAWREALRTSWTVGIRFIPVILLAILLMGAVQTLLPQDLIDRWLSDASGWRGLGIAWIAGLLTPAGGLMALPLAGGLYKAGVGSAVLVTYLVSVSTLTLVKLPIEVGLLEPRLALIRFLVCLPLPLLAGGLTRLVTTWIR